MKSLVSVLFVLPFISCTSMPKHSYKFIEIPENINSDPEKSLSKEQVQHDLAQLKFALNNVYSGSKHLPGDEFSQLLKGINQIEGPSTSKNLCSSVATHLDKVSDNHLNAKFNDRGCLEGKTKQIPSVGDNFYTEKKIPWSVKYQDKDDKKALLISITSFHKRSSPVWNGFLDKVKKMEPAADLVMLDMRGNGGGDDQIGYELSALLAGNTIKTPYDEQWNRETPESFQIFVNTFEYWARARRKKGEEVPKYIIELKKTFEDKRDRALTGEKVTLGDQQGDSNRERSDFDLGLSIKKPIYILIDAKCGSSCESTTDYFELNTLVKTVGENTAGYIHFGNNGIVILKNSGIKIQMAVSYNKYKDGRFLEKKGISPAIKVPSGENALEYAWTDYFNNSSED